MHYSFSITRVVVIVVLVLACGLVGCAGSASQPASSSPAAPAPAPKSVAKVTLSPATIDSTVKTLAISGTGFTPGTTVIAGIPTLSPQKNIPGNKGIWFTAAQVNEKGEFKVEADLANGLFRLITEKQITEEALAGTYSLVVEDDKGLKVETPLIITVSKKK